MYLLGAEATRRECVILSRARLRGLPDRSMIVRRLLVSAATDNPTWLLVRVVHPSIEVDQSALLR